MIPAMLQAASLPSQICSAINTGLLALDGGERVVLWNRWLAQHSEIEESAILGKPFAEAFPQLANGRVHRAIGAALTQGLASVISQTLNPQPFPLYVYANRVSRQPMQQACNVLPLICGAERYCLVQIQDVTAAVGRERELHRMARDLAEYSYLDGLTGIANRRAFDRQFQTEFRRAVREKRPLSVGMADVDQFKAYNDHCGHLAGDECLKRIAQALRSLLKRPADFVARYGGEEFVFLLPNTDAAGAEQVGRALCRKTLEERIPHPSSSISPFVSLSVGLACLQPVPGATPETLLLSADRALYQAKETGRNQVCMAAGC